MVLKNWSSAGEWGGIYAFVNNQGQWKREVLCDKTGWWNFVVPVDVNGDGKTDLVAGNLGLNSRLWRHRPAAGTDVCERFDDNGHRDQVVTLCQRKGSYTRQQRRAGETDARYEETVSLCRRLCQIQPGSDILPAGKLESSLILQTNFMSSAVLINHGIFSSA